MNAAPNDRGHEYVRCNDMQSGKYPRNDQKGRHSVPSIEPDQEGWNPTENYPHIRNHIDQARDESGHEGIIQMHDSKKNPTGSGENSRHNATAHDIAAQNDVYVVQCARHVSARSVWKKLDCGSPEPGFRSMHEKNEKRKKCPKQQTRSDRPDPMQ